MTRKITPIADICALFEWLRLIHRIKPDAVNASTPKAGLLGVLSARILAVPKRIYVVRGLRLEGATGLLAGVLWLMERATIACATDVIFVSPSLAREAAARRLGARRKGWVVGAGSSNGVDAPAILARAQEVTREGIRKNLRLQSEDFVIGFVGRVTRDKGIDTLIAAFQEAHLPPTTKLVIVGWVEDEQLRARLAALGERVRLVGGVDNVPAYMSAMDVLCLPTRREGFPNVVLEAAVLKLPVIASRATGSVDAVVDGETGMLIDIGDDRALALALEQLHKDRARARTLGASAHRRATQDFAPTDIWRGVVAILQSNYREEGLHPVSSYDSIHDM